MGEKSAALIADLRALLDHAGERGLPLTDTGRLRIADVRAINARFADPEELDHLLGDHTYRLRSEDQAWRVHFLRLAAQAAGLLDARQGRVRCTAGVRAFERRVDDDAARELFVAWWWKGAWDLLVPPGAPQLALMRDRAATASALIDLGTATHRTAPLGDRLRRTVAPRVPASTNPFLDEEAWGYAAWHLCGRPLAAFDGCLETNEVETINGHPFEHLAALGLTDRGIALLRAALDARPAAAPRIRRGMRTPYPPPRAADAADDTLAWAVEGERRERILRDHPEYRDAIARGVERVGEVNPRAHIALHTGIDEQLAGNDPPEVRATFDRLLALDHDRHDVEHALANVLTRELWAAQSEHRAFDNAHYLARLADLPLDDTATDTEDDAPDADMVLELPPATLTAADREKLHQLPRSLGTWEGDLTDLPIDVGRRGSPLCALWADTADGTVRSLTPDFDVAPGDLTLAAFVAAALRPKEGRAELPARVRVHPELATALRAALGELGVDVDAAEELAFAHDALDSLARFLAEPAPPRRRRRRRRHGRAPAVYHLVDHGDDGASIDPAPHPQLRDTQGDVETDEKAHE